MDNEIKWGAEIPVKIVDGKKPEFLRVDQICAVWNNRRQRWSGLGLPIMSAYEWDWHSEITKIRLLADDPCYETKSLYYETKPLGDQAATPESVDIELRKWAMEQAIAAAPNLNEKVLLVDLADLILEWVTKKP